MEHLGIFAYIYTHIHILGIIIRYTPSIKRTPLTINQPALTWPVQGVAIIGEYKVRGKSLTWTVYEFWLHREANIDYLRELWERFMLAIYTANFPNIATL